MVSAGRVKRGRAGRVLAALAAVASIVAGASGSVSPAAAQEMPNMVLVELIPSGGPSTGWATVDFNVTCWSGDPFDSSFNAVILNEQVQVGGDGGTNVSSSFFGPAYCEVRPLGEPAAQLVPASVSLWFSDGTGAQDAKFQVQSADGDLRVQNPRRLDGVVPVFWFGDPIQFTVSGCPSGSGSATLDSQYGDDQTVTLTEVPVGSGEYRGEFAPNSAGSHTLTTTVTCPGGNVETRFLLVYIDPSGTVVDQFETPLPGATVTLMRADTCDGVFTPVPDGSDIMSPANRTNPVLTGSSGQFAWDVAAGCYRADAVRPGCTNPFTGGPMVSTDPLPVPPEWTGLILQFHCPMGPPTRPEVGPTVPGGGPTTGSTSTTTSTTTSAPGSTGTTSPGGTSIPGGPGSGGGTGNGSGATGSGGSFGAALVRTGWNARIPVGLGVLLVVLGAMLNAGARAGRARPTR